MGKFIVIEGPDGTGKSTLIEGLKRELSDYKIKFMREPGGSPFGERVRELLLDNDTKIENETEALLFAAMRSENIAMLKAELKHYDAIISDRFLMSSLCYQGGGLNLGVEEVLKINDFALKGFRPDLTILLMMSAEEGIKRKIRDKKLDRLEERGHVFHQKVYDTYAELAKTEKNTIIVDASLPAKEVLKKVKYDIIEYIR